MLIAFDIDGTLADLMHRLHYIRNEEGTKDWDAFFKACKFDNPIDEMVELCNDLIYAENTIVFVSGRSSVCRAATVRWLDKHIQVSTDYIRENLFMREKDDKRPDYQVKTDLLRMVKHYKHATPDIVFDDRQQVVDMWRNEGIRCCQVASGQF